MGWFPRKIKLKIDEPKYAPPQLKQSCLFMFEDDSAFTCLMREPFFIPKVGDKIIMTQLGRLPEPEEDRHRLARWPKDVPFGIVTSIDIEYYVRKIEDSLWSYAVNEQSICVRMKPGSYDEDEDEDVLPKEEKILT